VFILGNDVMIFNANENVFSRLDGGILLALFGGFLFYIYLNAKKPVPQVKLETANTGTGDILDDHLAGNEEEEIKVMSPTKAIIYVVLGMAGLVGGGTLVLDNSVFMAKFFGMTERVIGLTVVAIGTSLPELATSAVAAAKGNSDIAIGNVIGSNIFNILLVLAISTLVTPVGYDVATNFDIYFLVGATIVLFLFLFIGTRGKNGSYVVDKWQAAILFLAVSAYTTYLVMYAK
ncbi:MAG: hypothetical protein MK212_13145, partial [Saprospiraceae bacterium]|nr:hypothetical protein [Saprospiraceae bacterium]